MRQEGKVGEASVFNGPSFSSSFGYEFGVAFRDGEVGKEGKRGPCLADGFLAAAVGSASLHAP